MATHKSDLLPWIKTGVYEEIADRPSESLEETVLISEAEFVRMLRLERRRTERSERAYMFVLIRHEAFCSKEGRGLLDRVIAALSGATRETDILGWYETGATLGLLMTEIGEPKAATIEIITQKLLRAIQAEVTLEEFHSISFQFRVFPHEVEKSSGDSDNHVHYPDISRRNKSRYKSGHVLKRVVDIVGSLMAILLFMPVFMIIAILVKITSRGPVLFCQKRVGCYGKEFSFYKFRTMYTGNDPRIHQEYVAKLIAGGMSGSSGVYKIVNDPRITPIGRILRKSSLDELPQFFNVLKNDMSLVGPRPPLPYEFERYRTWHKRRVLELKPGLTGLWQVEGRSRTTFDEMVRMDLRYGMEQSFWYDLKILLQTPFAMVSGRGAC